MSEAERHLALRFRNKTLGLRIATLEAAMGREADERRIGALGTLQALRYHQAHLAGLPRAGR